MAETPVSADVAAFEALYVSYGPRMKSVALALLGNRTDAEDAVHDAFVKAYRSRHTFRHGSQLYTWVYCILLNTCRDMGRRRVVRGLFVGRDNGDVPEVQAAGPDQSLRFALERALVSLGALHREVFVLCEVEGHTHGEVAEILGIPEGTSKSRLAEARRQLKALLWGTPPEGEK